MLLWVFVAFILLPSQAFAVSVTASSFLDLSTFAISGVAYELTPRYTYQGAIVTLDTKVEQDLTTPDWTDHTLTNTVGTLTATSISDPSRLLSSIGLNSSGSAVSFVERSAFIRALAPGFLTVSIGYGLTAPAPTNGLGSMIQTQLLLGDNWAIGKQSSGTLSLTRWFGNGEQATLGLSTLAHASVPEPSTLSFFIGLLGLVIAWHRAA
jgi:hypothetical protein